MVMKTLNEILRELQSEDLYESQEDELVKEILKEIDMWFEDETEKQNWIETNLRSKNKSNE